MRNIFKENFLNVLIFLLIIIIPIQTRYFLHLEKINNIFFEYESMSIYVTDIFIIFFSIYLFIYNLKNKLFKFNNKKRTFLLLLILINIILNISITQSINKNISIYFNLRFFLFSIFIFLLSFIKVNKENIKNAFVYSSFIQSIFAIIQFKNQEILSNKFLGLASHYPYELGTSVIENVSGRFLRSYGFLPHPNILGFLLFIGFTFIFFKILNIKNEKNNKILFLNYFILGIIFIGIILTFSRMIFLMLILFFIFIILYEFKKYFIDKKSIGNYNKKFFIIFIILLSNFFIFKSLIFTRIVNSRLNNISNNERMGQYSESINMIKENFLFGVGERNYTIYKMNNSNISDPYNLKPIHNIYVLIFSEIGFFGFLIFVTFLLIPIFIKFDLEIKFLYLLILISGIFDHFLLTEGFGVFILLFIIGIIFTRNKEL